MPTNIELIQPRQIDFRTQANADWIDGLSVWQSGAGGVVASATNAGNGALVVESVAPSALLGAHVVEVTSLDGIPRITIAAPDGTVTGRGVVGASCYASGITLRLTLGAAPFAVGDTFAIFVLPVPIDITGIGFELQARASARSANVALSASSAPTDGSVPTIVVGTTGGQVSMHKLRAAMDRTVFAPGAYVYDILAIADGLRVPAFYGSIEHVDGVTYLP